MERAQSIASKIRLDQTSCACPEQYDAYLGDDKVGYLRLRHGRFIVEVPDVGGRLVYASETLGDGAFEPCESDRHLNAAKEAIAACHAAQGPS